MGHEVLKKWMLQIDTLKIVLVEIGLSCKEHGSLSAKPFCAGCTFAQN